jgi:hypothetical protein
MGVAHGGYLDDCDEYQNILSESLMPRSLGVALQDLNWWDIEVQASTLQLGALQKISLSLSSVLNRHIEYL